MKPSPGTGKPRMILTLDPDVHAVLHRFAKATGKPAATFVAELLAESRPMIEQLARAAEAAKERRAEAMDMLMQPLLESSVDASQTALAFHKKRAKLAAAAAAAADRKGPELIGKKPRVKRG